MDIWNGIWEVLHTSNLARMQPASGQRCPFRGIDRIRRGNNGRCSRRSLARSGERWVTYVPTRKRLHPGKPDAPGWAAGRTDRIAKLRKKIRKKEYALGKMKPKVVFVVVGFLSLFCWLAGTVLRSSGRKGYDAGEEYGGLQQAA